VKQTTVNQAVYVTEQLPTLMLLVSWRQQLATGLVDSRIQNRVMAGSELKYMASYQAWFNL